VPEDRSPSFDGTVEVAEEYLERAFHRWSPPPEQWKSVRELYDTCDWSDSSTDQMNFLDRAPRQQKFETKLRWVTNASSRVDGLEYRHLRALNPYCFLLETVCKVVWKVGIPNCWKIS
jgi:hypothetical protein